MNPVRSFAPGRALFIAAAALLLPLALLSANFAHFAVERHQLFSWYLTYVCGYISRGLIGSILYVLHGGASPPQDTIIQLIEFLSPLLLFVALAMLAALLLLPLLRTVPARRPQTNWLLLGFAFLLAVSPLWKFAAYLKGHMDLWVFICALVALAFFLFNRPILFALTLIIGSMLHRLMVPFALVFYLLLLHSVFFTGQVSNAGRGAMRAALSAKQKRLWLAAGGVSLAVIVLLQLLAAVSGGESCAILQSGYAHKESIAEDFKLTRSAPAMLLHAYAKWRVLPHTFAISLFFFFLPPLLTALFFSVCCRLCALNFPASETASSAAPLPAPLEKSRALIFILLPIAGALCTAPLHIGVSDWSRVHYWSWFGLALVCIYYLWNLTEQAPAAVKNRKKKSATPSLALGLSRKHWVNAATAAVFAAALTYNATPLIWSNIAYPQLIKLDCKRFCFFPFTQNPLGHAWGQLIYTSIADAGRPLYATGSQLQHYEMPGMQHFQTDGDSIRIPPGDSHRPIITEFTFRPYSTFSYKVHFASEQHAPFVLTINRGPSRPTEVTPTSMEWRGTTDQNFRRLIFRLTPKNQTPLTLHAIEAEVLSNTPPAGTRQ